MYARNRQRNSVIVSHLFLTNENFWNLKIGISDCHLSIATLKISFVKESPKTKYCRDYKNFDLISVSVSLRNTMSNENKSVLKTLEQKLITF